MKSKGLLIVLIGISLGFWVHWSLGVILFLVGVYVGVKEDEKQRAAEEAGQAEKAQEVGAAEGTGETGVAALPEGTERDRAEEQPHE
ncbi:MAG: hypothetical protein IKI54_00875 [Lachnospiraceae bacterium]|nr:hypothetical protein [Lachnospiraceae bacterium]